MKVSDMTKGNSLKLILRFAIPLFIGTLFQQAYNMIDTMIAGYNIGDEAIAYNMCAAFLQALGNSNIPLYFLIVSCIINLSLDCLFIAGFHMGVVGAGFATIIAESISALSCMIYIFKKYREYLPGKKDWKLDKTLTFEMFTTGTSMGLMLSVFSLGSIILQKAINNLGTQIITAHTASRRIYEVFAIPLSTAATATATFVGQNFGARKYERIDNALKKIILAALLWSAVSIVIAIFAGEFMVRLLIDTNDPVIIENALLNLRLSTAFFFPLGVLIIMRNAMQSMGYKVAFTEPIIWVLCAVFIVVVYLTGRRKVGK